MCCRNGEGDVLYCFVPGDEPMECLHDEDERGEQPGDACCCVCCWTFCGDFVCLLRLLVSYYHQKTGACDIVV